MAYDEQLAARIGAVVNDWPDCTSKKMFGGVGWLLRGNLCVGIWKGSLVVRCAPADTAALLKKKHVRKFDITRRPMKGWLLVEPEGIATPAALKTWLALARDFVSTLPEKQAARKWRALAGEGTSPTSISPTCFEAMAGR